MDSYQHQKINDHLYRIVDGTGVCCYLVIGTEKACLLDTCSGFGNLKEYVDTLTDKEVFVILTHGHLDHIGGAGLYDEVYLNNVDLPVYQEHGAMDFRVSKSIDMVHRNFTEADFVPTYEGELKDINDGDIFDLGGVTIKMIAVKGHTPGMMCPLLIEDRIIFFGDACGISVLLFDEHSSTVSEYKQSLLALKEYEDQYDTIYRNHGSFVSQKPLLDNVIECCDLILAGSDDRFPVTVHGFELFACHEVAGHGRADGKEGNILYLPAKAV